MKITDRMIWAGAKAAFFEMCCIQHDHEKLWSEERKLKGNVWYDVAKAALNAAENERAEMRNFLNAE